MDKYNLYLQTPSFIIYQNQEEIDLLRQQGYLLLPLPKLKNHEFRYVAQVYNNIMLLEYFNYYEFDEELFREMLWESKSEVTIEEIKKTFDSQVYAINQPPH